MTVQNHNQAVASERPAVTVQNPVTGSATARRMYSVSMDEHGYTITNEAPYTQEAGVDRTEWDGPYDGVAGRFILINTWATSREGARHQALQIPHNLF